MKWRPSSTLCAERVRRTSRRGCALRLIRRSLAAALVPLALLTAGCGAPDLPAGGGGTLVLSTASDPKTFNPIVAKETSTTAVTGFIFDGLTMTDAVTLEVKPALAESWTVSPDGRTWRFILRDGLQWSDGEPVTADDVAFTFNRLIFNDQIPTSSRDVFLVDGKPIEVTAENSRTVVFRLPERFAPFVRLLGQEILPRHILEQKVDAGIFSSSWGVNENPSRIVGTGPFLLKQYRPGELIVLERNPRYWKRGPAGERLPRLDRIVLVIIADPNMAVLKFRAGELDAVHVRGQDYPILKPFEKRGNFTIYEIGPSLGCEFLVFNQSSKAKIDPWKRQWFSLTEFRQAVSCCLDRDAMIRNVLAGFGSPQEGPMNASCGFFFNPQTERYGYDPARARQLLARGGFSYGDGVLRDRDGRQVEFTILTNSNNADRIQIASIIQDDLKRAGMKVNLLPVEFNTLVTRLTVSNDWEAILIGLTGGIEPHNGRNVWDSRGHLHMWNLAPDEVTPWEREIDRLFAEGARELDEVRRKRIYDRWQEIASRELPLIYTVNATVMQAVRNRFENLRPTVYGGVFHNIEEIAVKPPAAGGGGR